MTAAEHRGPRPRKVLVVGLGNPDRGDDGVGALVARELTGRLPADVTVLTVRGDMLSLVEQWAEFDVLVCVDAAASMTEPGRVHRFDLARTALPRAAAATSSHGLGLAEAIELSRVLDRAPPEIIVYAVEGACFAAAAAITPEVAAGASETAARIVAEVASLMGSSDGGRS